MKPKIAAFKGKEIRKIIHNNEWWFSVVDVCAVLTDSTDAGAYWRKLKQRLKEEGSEVVTFCHGLKVREALNCLQSVDSSIFLTTGWKAARNDCAW
jgi:prophage antirepressor-like protein